ncbi:MAG: methyl-accepting chemotaxis protein, partial [Ktedonobacteraceae bacterium]
QRSITGPLTELVSLTKRISKGDTNARVKIEGRDEISIVANAMNNMLDNIVHLIQDTQSQRDVLQGQVEKLVSEVSGVGEGDLRVQAEVTADALGVLADSFNYMVEELGSLVVRVKMVAREVEESTTVTSDRMSELVEVADRQIQQIASAALEIEHMALSSQQMANRALGLSSSAREVRLSTQEGRLAVQQTIEGMGRISLNVQETSHKVQNLGESSREINNIVEAISTIAHQTNRLALDAAIQAAMAGDNGKGFGAVAADIRRLAERAKEQATSIGRIVRNVRDEIGAVAVSMRDTERETASGAKLAEEAGTSLESIFTVIERQAREIDVINQMAMQQQQSSNNVVQIMQGVSESTQDSSSSTREAAQNMERIARLAEQLLASVEAFKLREGLNYFAPNAAANGLEEEGVLTMSGAFRTVTATVQPVSNGNNSYIGLPAPNSESGFSQFSPSFPSLGRTNSQPLFQPQGSYNNQQFFPQQEQNNSQQFFSQQEQNNNQQFFPQQGQNNGQQFFPQQEQNNSQQFFPQQGQNNGQQFFSQQGQNNGQQFFPQPRPNNGQQPFSQPGHNNGQQFFPQAGPNNGQQSFSQQEQRNSQPLPPLQRPGNAQQPFPQQGKRMPNESQWPDLDNEPQWSDSNNGWQSGSKNW